MFKKEIKLVIEKEKTIRLMELSEIIAHFDALLKSFADDCVIKSKNVYGNIDEFEDYYSLGVERLIYCLSKYEPTDCFSTYLTNGLEQLKKDIFKKMFAKKRQPNMNLISLENEIQDNVYVYDVEGYYDDGLIEREIISDLKHIMKKFTKEETKILLFILNNKQNKKQLAEDLDVSRPTLNIRIENMKNKLIKRLPEYFSCETN